MLDGLWTVEFFGPLGLYGTGVLVIKDRRALGGDAGYYYSGTCNERNNQIQGQFTIRRYDRNSISVFGPLEEFSLTLKGNLEGNKFLANGSLTGAPDQRIQVTGTKKEDY